MKQIIEAMNWRYAVNKFDTTKKLSDQQIGELLEAVRLAPSSFGLQPWKIIVVSNPEIRMKLREAGFGQPKISEASHLVVFAVEKKMDEALVDRYIEMVSQVRGTPVDALKGYAEMIKGAVTGRTPEQRIEWATRQAYIALGVLLTAAAVSGIDAGPMEGFNPSKFDEILGLDKMGSNGGGLETKVIAALGFRASDDPSAQYKKVRFPMDKLMIEVK